MKLIVGLWNPWKEYEQTRHNIWFVFLDFFASEHDFPDFKKEEKMKSKLSTKTLNNEKIILCKPQTFMNLSGEAIRKIVDFYKIQKEDIIVIYDDISLDFGKIRYRDTGSAWGHNWVKSTISHIGKDFKRIKIWVWLHPKYEVSDWVLSKFSKEEQTEIDETILTHVEENLLKLI